MMAMMVIDSDGDDHNDDVGIMYDSDNDGDGD